MGGFWSDFSLFCSERGKTKLFDSFSSYGHPQQKGLQGQEFSGLPQDILSKRQKAREGGAYSAPPGPPCFEGLKDDHTLLAQRALWFIQSYTTSSSIHK